MSGGTAEIYRDSEPLVECIHRGSSGASVFLNRAYKFDTFVRPGVYAENETQSTGGLVTAAMDHEVTVAGVTWDNGDTLKVYMTAVKGQVISTIWTDLSRGWKTHPDDLEDGWRHKDVDLDRDAPGEVFGPGQPENYRK